jgi:hypothetical protein
VSNRTETAARIIKSWSNATGVDIPITPVEDDDETAGVGVYVSARDICSTDDISTKAFAAAAHLTGKKVAMPDRGAVEPDYGEDLFLVAARHREFRGTPNLTKSQQKFYEPILRRACSKFLRLNRTVCSIHNYELDDLMTYAWMWAHIHAHRYDRGVEGDTRLLSAFLRQRFSYLHRQLTAKVKQVHPDQDTVNDLLINQNEDDGDDLKPVRARQSVRSVRRSVVTELDMRLRTLPHDEMISKLEQQVSNQNRDHSTRMTALRYLRRHAPDCTSCAGRQFSLESQPVQQWRQEYIPDHDAPSVPELILDQV